MGVVQVGLSEELASVINQQVEAGRVESTDAYLAEAIRRGSCWVPGWWM